MKGAIEIPESELRQHKIDGKTDAEIGRMYGTDTERVRTLRRRYGITALSYQERQEQRGELHRCANPLCNNDDKFRVKGLCMPCYNYRLRTGRDRFADGYQAYVYNTQTLCRNCKQSRVIRAKGMCDTCYRYYVTNGKMRTRKHFLRNEECKNCGKPRSAEKWGWRRGRCDLCAKYWRKHKVERPPKHWRKWCECGNAATHIGVPLKLMTVEKGIELIEHYDLCEDCWQLENEPLLTKGESKWER